MRRSHLSLPVFIITLSLCVAGTVRAGVTDSLSYQGSLTDAQEIPVSDGPHDLIISVWSDSTGGSMLHSEVVTVTTHKGLFSTCIGCSSSTFFDIFTDLPRFLQLQVGGQPPLLPRTRLRSVPFSVTASSVHSEATNGNARARGIVATKPGLPGTTMSSTLGLNVDSDGDGIDDMTSGILSTPDSATMRLNGLPPGTPFRLSTNLSIDKQKPTASFGARCDKDGDGNPDMSADVETGSDSATFRLNGLPPGTPYIGNLTLKTKGSVVSSTLSTMSGSTTGTIRMSATPDSSSSSVENDDDNDGISDVGLKTDASGKPKRLVNSHFFVDRNHDGVSDMTADIEVDNDSSSLRLNGLPPGTPYIGNVAMSASGGGGKSILSGMSGSTTGTIRMSASPDSSANDQDNDFDGNGHAEAGIHQKVWHASNFRTMQNQFTDSNNDGTEDMSVVTETNGDSASLRLNGLPPGTPYIGNLTMKTKGNVVSHSLSSMSGSTTGTIRMMSTPDSTVAIDEGDLDGDGNAECRTRQKTWTSANFRTSLDQTVDSDDNGITDVSSSIVTDADSATMRLNGLPPGTPVTGTLSLKASGSVTREILSSRSGSTTATIRMATTNDSSVFSLGYSGSTTATIRMEASASGLANPIEHSSGAHLTPGGVWTNASDKNLKENFEKVDGADILEKVAELPVSRWNYKSESVNVTHIGPTAQDFKATFGVGESDKTISTIDPSGIALVAIKELKKENNELRKELNELRQMMKEIKKQKK